MIMSSLAKEMNQTINLAEAFIQNNNATVTSSAEVNERTNHLKLQKNNLTINTTLQIKSNSFKTKSSLSLPSPSPSQLLEIQDVPKYLQFNPYIRRGYRKMLSTGASVKSLFYFHNETINVLSHGIPIVYILWTVPSLIPWDKINSTFLPICHIVGSVSPWVGSFLYHLFMNHAHGEKLYRRLLQLDMIGIWVTQSFGALPMVCTTSFCYPWSIRWMLIFSYCLMSAWGLHKAVRAWSPWDRRMCFALPFVTRLFLVILRATGMGGGDPAIIGSVFLQDFVSLVGGIIGAVNIPERWFPGQFDFCFNSHNIMHILVVLAVYYMHQATVADLKWMASVDCTHSALDTR